MARKKATRDIRTLADNAVQVTEFAATALTMARDAESRQSCVVPWGVPASLWIHGITN